MARPLQRRVSVFGRTRLRPQAQSTLCLLRKIEQDKGLGRIEVVLTRLVDDPDMAPLRCQLVGKNLIYLAHLQILVLVGFVLGLRWLFTQGKGSRSDAALDTLRQRYARGEIGQEEFEAKKRDLTS